MKTTALIVLLAFAANAQGQGVECEGQCLAIYRAAINWVVDTHKLAPADLVIDSVDSGRTTAFSDRSRPRMLPGSTFAQIATLVGAATDSRDNTISCPKDRLPHYCSLRKGKMFATFSAIEPNPAEAEAKIQVTVQSVVSAYAGSAFYFITYTLWLRREGQGNQWRLVKSGRTVQS